MTVKHPDGSTVVTVRKPVTATGGNTCGELIAKAIPFTANTAGILRIEAALTPDRSADVQAPLMRTELVNVIDPQPVGGVTPLPRVAVLKRGQGVSTTLTDVLHLTAMPYHPGGAAGPAPDVIVLASRDGDPDFDAIAS